MAIALWIAISVAWSQLQQSGGVVSVTIGAGTSLIGTVGIDQTTPGTTNGVSIAQIAGTAVTTGAGASTAGTQRVITATDSTIGTVTAVTTVAAVTAITNALPAGGNLLGFVKALPSGCTSGTTLVVRNTVGVATGGGTSVSSVTGCIVECFANNITNSAVTIRIADKTGTPIIWLGGNADFSIPANSNLGCASNSGVNLAGILMANGITAIAGTASAINLHLLTYE